MITRILTVLALVASFSAVSIPSFAADDEIAAPDSASVEATSPVPPPRCEPWMRNCNVRCEPWMRNCRPPMRNFQCYARNVLGRTFVAYGNWRTPRQWVAQRALQQCRYGSLPFIRNTCRFIGCR